jgi:glyoxylase-like metal-dependent hydrolase (beta-lactamase superfamily II)
MGIVYSFHWCFWCFVFIGDILNNFAFWPGNLAFQSFNFERTWWRLLHKHVERLTPHSTTFQLYHGGQFYWWRKQVSNGLHTQNKCYFLIYDRLWVWCLTPLSTTFQLYHGGQFYWWWRKPVTNGLHTQNKYYFLLYDRLWVEVNESGLGC